MAELKCSIIEKLASEGKISTHGDPTPPFSYKQMRLNLKIQNQNYHACNKTEKVSYK